MTISAAVFVIAGAYGVGAWLAGVYVTTRWVAGERPTVSSYLRMTGWCAIGVFLLALGSDLA
jgi:hypothetical protein